MLRTIEIYSPAPRTDSTFTGVRQPCVQAPGQSATSSSQTSRHLALADHADRRDTLPAQIFKRADIVRQSHASDIVRQATDEANVLLERAHLQAEDDRARAIRLGIEAGVNACITPMLGLLAQLQCLQSELRETAAHQIKQAVTDLLGRTPTLAAMVDAVVDENLPAAPSALRIVTPVGVDGDALLAHCQARSIAAHLRSSTRTDEFSISWEGHHWSADFDMLTESMPTGVTDMPASWSAPTIEAEYRSTLRALAERSTIPGLTEGTAPETDAVFPSESKGNPASTSPG